jgi:hypothetical protein
VNSDSDNVPEKNIMVSFIRSFAMKIEPSGVVLIDVCGIQTSRCVAQKPSPVTAIWTSPGRTQINVCRPCLEEQIRAGEWEIQGARVEQRVDVAVYSTEQQLQLVVEVKKPPTDTTVSPKQWAAQIRKNLFVHSGIPNAPYFLLAAVPEFFYLWKNHEPLNYEKAPDYVIEAKVLLANYLSQTPSTDDQTDSYSHELIISSWLNELIQSKNRPQNNLALKWTLDSGLYQAIQNGKVVMESRVAA